MATHTIGSTQKPVTIYPNFDWLRLLLAAQVVAIHCGISPTVFINPVPAFLAISGFVVLGSMERRPLPHFFISRALRVLPLLGVSFLAVWFFYDLNAMFKTYFSGCGLEETSPPIQWYGR